MHTTLDYSDIAPFQDCEVKAILNDLKQQSSFLELLNFMKIDSSPENVDRLFENIHSIDAFQKKISKPWVSQFLTQSTTAITHSGFEYLGSDQKQLFISNHRDIILDSAILNILLLDQELQTVETAIGNNLLKSKIVRTLTKLNKNFTVQREGTPREKYNYSKLLSSYIRTKVTKKQSSIWLAQREGRAKDGNDTTQQGLIKMLNLSNTTDFEEGFKALNIHPMSLSYEYDPCDRFKLKELVAAEKGEIYTKEKDEDFQSIITGILGFKGRVHLCIQPKLGPIIDRLKRVTNLNDKATRLAKMIDQSIYHSYQLFENNYVAFDLLHDTQKMSDYYCKAKKEEFEAYVNTLTEHQDPLAKTLLLKKYAYPVMNSLG